MVCLHNVHTNDANTHTLASREQARLRLSRHHDYVPLSLGVHQQEMARREVPHDPESEVTHVDLQRNRAGLEMLAGASGCDVAGEHRPIVTVGDDRFEPGYGH